MNFSITPKLPSFPHTFSTRHSARSRKTRTRKLQSQRSLSFCQRSLSFSRSRSPARVLPLLLLLQPLVSALDGKPDNAAELFERVSQSIKVKRYSEALNDLNAAIEADPALSEAYYHWASILRQICRYEESEKSYKKFLELKPQDSVAEKEVSQLRGYLGPYKGERYHLPDFCRGAESTGHKEVFNHMHSSLRSIIERTFGVWKKRWAILRDMPNYPVQ